VEGPAVSPRPLQTLVEALSYTFSNGAGQK
jgi:hypothetical protein